MVKATKGSESDDLKRRQAERRAQRMAKQRREHSPEPPTLAEIKAKLEEEKQRLTTEPPTLAEVKVFPVIKFRGELRPSQTDVAKIAREQIEAGEKQLYIVAPPGSGKTVTGLYLWAEVIRQPALVLSPNTAIQSQWAARTDLFTAEGGEIPAHWISTDPEQPALLTSLTYQSVTLPARGDETLDSVAIMCWMDNLLVGEKQLANTPEEAQVWIKSLQENNPDYYNERLAFYRKKMRDDISLGGDTLKVLHTSALRALERLRNNKVGLVILDECHHLMGHWGRVLAAVNEYLGNPIVLGLTATPPDTRKAGSTDVGRYMEYFGPVDYEVPVPAVVKDGFLAPYQDLAYLVRPLGDELEFIADASKALDELVDELCNPPRGDDGLPVREGLIEFTMRILSTRDFIMGKAGSWDEFEKRASKFAISSRLFLMDRGELLPADVPGLIVEVELAADQAYWLDPLHRVGPTLSWYCRHGLRRSEEKADHELADKAISRLRLLGTQITETGTMSCASPVSRILAYSRAKAEALIPILTSEKESLGDTLRAVVICDYERTSAVTAELSHLLDDEAGGAIAAFRELLTNEETDKLDPVLLTGSTVLVDDDLKPNFETAARHWLASNKYSVDFDWDEKAGFYMLQGKGGDWCPRVYVEMITELFQMGVTRCLVGTRGLLGEGWDANKINVLIDLTCVTTSMSINQLRGRSFRLDPEVPDKIANNWDVICIAPEFKKGLDDYKRFLKKHKHLYGVTDDGAIEKGEGHVHAAFTEIKPEGVEENMVDINRNMLERVGQRDDFRNLWRIGEPYNPTPVKAVEIRAGRDPKAVTDLSPFPPFLSPGSREPWTDGTLTLAIGRAIIGAFGESGMLGTLNYHEMQKKIHSAERAGGYVRAFLEDSDEATNAMFADAMAEVFGPVVNARYVIQREADFQYEGSRFANTWVTRHLPRFASDYIVKKSMETMYRREVVRVHAVPRELARNKKRASKFEEQWNIHVSPGNIWYYQTDGTKSMMKEAVEKGWLPYDIVRQKEVFL